MNRCRKGKKIPCLLIALILTGAAAVHGEDLSPSHPVFGITPLALIWLASQSQASGDAAPTPNQPSPGGSVYFGGAQGNQESLIGVSVYSDFFDVSLQNRVYWSKGNAGLFAGTFASVEFLGFRYFDNPTQGMTLTNEKGKGAGYLLAGVRLGGNVGMRMNFGLFGLTPRIGLTLPLFYIFDSFGFDKEQNYRFYVLNAVMRAFEVGLTLDWGIEGAL